MAAPPSLQQLQTAMGGVMDELQRSSLIPLQKEAFICSANCCDQHQDMRALQQCTVNCQRKVEAAHQVLYGNLEDFQKRFQRCLMRCDDLARESLPSRPNDKDISKAQDKQLSCMDACAVEYQGKIPKLKADMTASLQKMNK
eukprot:GHRR01011520.1.p1 GENE.GHRR01011520.1~~GHRR01011520.1.p1  ORF type:complete len:142 (+),score=37.72 GHRR01011520.1:218-643(+)